MIQAQQLSKRYRGGQGIHELSFSVAAGESYGFVGPNGAGKSTTIRCLMGFLKPTAGQASIAGRDCWQDAAAVHALVGYVPGEVVLPGALTGTRFLQDIHDLYGLRERSRQDALLDRLQFDPDQAIRLMSKGTRQKLALVAALMHDPAVLILDEPTSGFDPLMQQAFVDLMQDEQARGTTLFLSSHIFSEIERVCDRVAILKAGQIVVEEAIGRLRAEQEVLFDVTLSKTPPPTDVAGLRVVRRQGLVWTVAVQRDYPAFFETLARLPVTHLQQRTQDLEALFRHFYAEEGPSR